MGDSSEKKLFTPKILLIGIVSLFVLCGIFLFLGIAQKNTIPPITPPSHILNNQVFPTTPPDKQIEGQVVVKFKSQYSTAQIAEHLKIYNASIVKQIQGINYTVVKVPAGQENALLEKLKNDPYIENALPDYTNHTTYVPNDTNFTFQYGLHNTGQTILNVPGKAKADINVEPAWDVSKGNGVKVAILDSGIDQNHPELANKVVLTKVFATSAIDPNVQDHNGHGTHVAGIIAATTNNGQGVAGTCPDCQLMIGKVVTNDSNGNATGSTSDIVSGITWAADNGAKVINLSLRTTTSGSAPLYQQGIDYANSKGVVVVVAAGNDASNAQVWPAANTGVVSVAATDNQDQMASFSNYGTFVKVAAPGVNILSTLPTTTNAKKILNYGYLSGTSMASPMVAGVIGLLWASPYGTSNTAVINRLYATADKIAGTGTNWTEGRINAGNALGALPTPTPTIPGGAFPSPQCVGGSGIPPCATFAPTIGVTLDPSPTLVVSSLTPSSVATQPVTSPQPSGSVAPSTTPGEPGVNPCSGTSSVAYVSDSENETASHKHHRKRRGSGGNGFFSQLFRYLMQLLERLFQLIRIGTPCSNTTPTPTPTPAGETVVPTISGVVLVSPSTN